MAALIPYEERETAAPLRSWLAMPMDTAAKRAIERIRLADDVAHIAVMPDVHLARDVCVGTAMAHQVIEILRSRLHVDCLESTMIHCDHNHVRREKHFGQQWLVHRKGAMPADEDLSGVIPGSMGSISFHVEGRGNADALRSSAHGAGRMFSRSEARQRFSRDELRRQMRDVWFDPRQADALRDEAPRAYKNIEAVLRAQADLVKITRRLRPLLVYKDT